MRRVLLVEDDEAMAVALRDGFDFEGDQVELAADGAAGLSAALRRNADIIILDVMLPKQNGLDICRELRRRGIQTPIIMLTARGQEIDKIVGLKAGADDYVTKPFSFMELLARVDAVLRRSRGAFGTDEVVFGGIKLNFSTHQATREGSTLDLSPREFRILRYFLDRPGEVVTREALLNDVWGYDSSAYSRTVDTHMARLRQKVEATPAEPRHLITVHRVGYKFLP
jgi:DNA-binding response OmpR family regulator